MKPMLATVYDEARVEYPCLVQPKYDGVRCLCLIGLDGEVHLLSRTGKEYNVPHLLKWADEHRELLPLDGEIYNHRELTFQQICSAVKCYSPLTDKLRFVVYDTPCHTTMRNRWEALKRAFAKNLSGPFYLSSWYIVDSKEQIDWYHDECVRKGYEGAIIRNLSAPYVEGRSNHLMKYKKFETNEYEVVDVLEAGGKDAGTAIFKLKVGEYEFHARPVGTLDVRRAYLRDKENIIGKMCTVQHQGYSDAGVPRFPVALTIRDYE